MEYITTKEAAEKWCVSQRRVNVMCVEGRILGAMRLGWVWAIPRTAEKPKDARCKTNKVGIFDEKH